MLWDRLAPKNDCVKESESRSRPSRLPAAAPAASAVVLLISAALPVFGHYPEIRELSREDAVFRQLQEDISAAHRGEIIGGAGQNLTVYQYRLEDGDDFFRIASRLTLSQASLATLNELSSPEVAPVLGYLLIPNVPGVFVPETPRSDLGAALAERLTEDENDGVEIHIRTRSGPRRFTFFPGADFTAEERREFLKPGFTHPLPDGRISSGFGPRPSPFTGRQTFHTGVDIAAPSGTAIRAARGGIVTSITRDQVYGLKVRIEHDEVYETRYAHLGQVNVELNERVTSGMIIGRVGNTGLTTGAHLHFEVHVHGEPVNPAAHVPQLSR